MGATRAIIIATRNHAVVVVEPSSEVTRWSPMGWQCPRQCLHQHRWLPLCPCKSEQGAHLCGAQTGLCTAPAAAGISCPLLLVMEMGSLHNQERHPVQLAGTCGGMGRRF